MKTRRKNEAETLLVLVLFKQTDTDHSPLPLCSVECHKPPADQRLSLAPNPLCLFVCAPAHLWFGGR